MFFKIIMMKNTALVFKKNNQALQWTNKNPSTKIRIDNSELVKKAYTKLKRTSLVDLHTVKLFANHSFIYVNMQHLKPHKRKGNFYYNQQPLNRAVTAVARRTAHASLRTWRVATEAPGIYPQVCLFKYFIYFTVFPWKEKL